MHKVGKTASGNVLVELRPHEWQRFAQYIVAPEDIGGAVKKYRREHGLSQENLGKELGVSRNYVSALERGSPYYRKMLERYMRIISIIV